MNTQTTKRRAAQPSDAAEPRMPRPPSRIAASPPIRAAMVARAKRLLAQGYYDNTHVLAFAVARMFDEVRSGRVSPARSHGPTPGREARGPSERAARWSQTAP